MYIDNTYKLLYFRLCCTIMILFKKLLVHFTINNFFMVIVDLYEYTVHYYCDKTRHFGMRHNQPASTQREWGGVVNCVVK